MYAAVRRYEGVTDPKEVRRHVEEEFLPLISEMPGFVAYYVVDAGEGVMVSTSVFEHQAAEEESSWRVRGEAYSSPDSEPTPDHSRRGCSAQVYLGWVAGYRAGAVWTPALHMPSELPRMSHTGN